MTLSKAQKLLAILLTIGGIASLAGTWLYIPVRMSKVEGVVEKDHDALIRVETKVESINTKLERNGVVNYEINVATNFTRIHLN